MAFRFPRAAYNWLSIAGAVIAASTFLIIIFLLAISFFLGRSQPYLGLVIYILLPGVLIAGLLMIPAGMIGQARRDKARADKKIARWPRLDLNDERHRNAFFIFIAGTIVFLFMSAFGSYEAYHFTESVEFCGKLCHQVMKPQYQAYQDSPHAQVACVACHVGPGAGWYVRSKLSGLYQVYATLTETYPRPIPTPIENLRPARVVCEQCHWPKKFYDYSILYNKKYLADPDNTEWNLRLIMKVGAESPENRLQKGIHWHLNPEVKIEYIAADRRRQVIPWVRYTNLGSGRVTVYQDLNEPLAAALFKKENIRVMDCIDCHNQPSHRYLSPSDFIDQGLASGEIPRELPNIKSAAVAACSEEYPSSRAAIEGIRRSLTTYYRQHDLDANPQKQKLVDQAVKGVQRRFSRNIFPEMRVRWTEFPYNNGHLEFAGCFRCHDGKHAASNSIAIRKDCDLCHLINAQGLTGRLETAANIEESLPFRHPVDINGTWRDEPCNQCHNGLAP